MILSKPIDFTTEEKLKNLNAQFLEAKDKHFRELDSSFEPMMEGFLRGFVESIPEIAGFLTRVCLGVLLQGGGNSHHGPPHFWYWGEMIRFLYLSWILSMKSYIVVVLLELQMKLKLDFPCSFTYLNHKFYPVLQKNIKIVNEFQKQTKTKKSSIDCVTITVAVDTWYKGEFLFLETKDLLSFLDLEPFNNKSGYKKKVFPLASILSIGFETIVFHSLMINFFKLYEKHSSILVPSVFWFTVIQFMLVCRDWHLHRQKSFSIDLTARLPNNIQTWEGLSFWLEDSLVRLDVMFFMLWLNIASGIYALFGFSYCWCI